MVPTDPARYLAVLSRDANQLGEGFVQRARKAASCHQTSNYLACCAMCGAAAESAILRAAIVKDGNENRVLKEYAKPGWRRHVIKTLFEEKPARLEENFITMAFQLLSYWRDETAHGRASAVSEIEAYHSLTVLLRFAQFCSSDGTLSLPGRRSGDASQCSNRGSRLAPA